MEPPLLRVETIAFRGHEPSAVPLQAGAAHVICAEFVRKSRRLPAAFVAPQTAGTITMQVTVSCLELAGQTVDVHASRLDGSGHTIQGVRPRAVTFDAEGQSGQIPFCADVVPVGVDLDFVRWQWMFVHDGTPEKANISDHRVAVILGTPQKPWTTATPTCDATLPLWVVVQHACAVARGARTPPEAADRITEAAYEIWGGRYYMWSPSAETFASDILEPVAFDCLRFLALIGAAPPPTKEIVDCTDIATIVSTFANILGCSLQQLALNEGLKTKPVKLVGHDKSCLRDFALHEIAVAGPPESREVWDGCLQVPGDQTGPGEPGPPLLPTGLGGDEYLDRLLREGRKPFPQHIFREALSRPLGPLPNLVPRPTWNEHLDKIAQEYGFHDWDGPHPGQVPTFNPMTAAGPGWSVLMETAFPVPESIDPDADAVARMVCTWSKDPTRRVRATVYVCGDADAARQRLLYLLWKIPERLTRLTDVPGISFRSPDGRTIVGAIRNVVYKIIDAGARVTMTMESARTDDARTMTVELTDRVLNLAPL